MWRAQSQTQTLEAPATEGEEVVAEMTTTEMVIALALEILFEVILIFFAAWLYIRHKPNPLMTMDATEREHTLDGKFAHGLFGCLGMPGMTIFTCCCEGIRWADSMRMLGMMTYTSAIMTYLVISCVCILLGAGSPFFSAVAVAMMLTYYRQGLRDKFSMESNWKIMALDCLSYAFCGPCAVVQDARQVEEAQILCHSAVKDSFPLSFSGIPAEA